jgi:hypothetical protein
MEKTPHRPHMLLKINTVSYYFGEFSLANHILNLLILNGLSGGGSGWGACWQRDVKNEESSG